MEKAKLFLLFGSAAAGMAAFNAVLGWWVAAAFHATAAAASAYLYRREARAQR